MARTEAAQKRPAAQGREHAELQCRGGPATARQRICAQHAQMKSLIFDCDGVILESEDLHRRAYNAAFEQFDVKCKGGAVEWTEDFYDVLQNKGAALRSRCRA